MLKQRRVQVALVISVLLLVAWWLWPTHRLPAPDNLSAASEPLPANQVSSIEPIKLDPTNELSTADIPMIDVKGSVAPQSLILDENVREKIALRFASVNQMISDDQENSAKAELIAMVNEFPDVIELYINLAALYAKSNQLDLARQTLSRGIEVNQNTALLFESRQIVLGAQAAQAYKRALNEPVTSTEPLLLPFISTMEAQLSNSLSDQVKPQYEATNTVQLDEIKSLKAQLEVSELALDESRRASHESQVEVAKLRKLLDNNER